MKVPRSRPSAFTLLEVLAAVAILGIVYIVLADVTMQGLFAEGRAKRRLEASLKADLHLSELEVQLEAGVVPPVGPLAELEEDGFRVTGEVRIFALPLPPQPGEVPKEAGSTATASTLDALREIELNVSWEEAQEEQRVVRITYALDATAVPAAPADAVPPEGSGEAREVSTANDRRRERAQRISKKSGGR